MSKKRKPKHIKQEDWDAVDSPELTRDWFKRARPAREVDPRLVEAYEAGTLKYRGQRGPQKRPTKIPVSIRLSPKVLAHFKATGEGWQTRLDDALLLIVGDGQ